MKKVMYAIFFRSTGLVNAIKLKGQKAVTVKWYTERCLLEVFNRVPDNRIMPCHDFWLFLDLNEICAYFKGIPKEDWLEAFKQWKEMMLKYIIAEGNYFEVILNEILENINRVFHSQ